MSNIYGISGLPLTGGTLTGELLFSGTTFAGINLNSLTTTQKNALTPAEGMLIKDSTLNRMTAYINGSWQTWMRTTGDTFSGLLTLTPSAANQGLIASTGGSNTGSDTTSAVNLAWLNNTSGTVTNFLVNVTNTASNAASLLFDWQVGGVSAFKLNTSTKLATFAGVGQFTGKVIASFFQVDSGVAGTAAVTISGAPGPGSSGTVLFVNPAINDFGLLQLGGTTASFPALGRSGARLTVGLANNTAGGGLNFTTAAVMSVASGTNQRAGNAVLVGGTVTVSNTTVTANTVVLVTRKTTGGTVGFAVTYTVSAGTSFTLTSDNALDTSTYSYWLMEVP